MFSLSEIESKLKENGCKMTEQRKIILEILLEGGRHYTAQEIYEKAVAKNSSMNFSTVYRNLELLMNMGIIKRMNINETTGHFAMNQQQHQHHLICKGCGEVKELDYCPYENIKENELVESDFVITDHNFEIFGYCGKCNKNKN